jgi:hypothetical protein
VSCFNSATPLKQSISLHHLSIYLRHATSNQDVILISTIVLVRAFLHCFFYSLFFPLGVFDKFFFILFIFILFLSLSLSSLDKCISVNGYLLFIASIIDHCDRIKTWMWVCSLKFLFVFTCFLNLFSCYSLR